MKSSDQNTQGTPSVVIATLTKPVTAVVHIDRETAIRAGKPNWGDVVVAVDTASLAGAQRELLANCKTTFVGGEHHIDLKRPPFNGAASAAKTPSFAEVDDGTVAAILDAWSEQRDRIEADEARKAKEAEAARARAVAEAISEISEYVASLNASDMLIANTRRGMVHWTWFEDLAKAIVADRRESVDFRIDLDFNSNTPPFLRNLGDCKVLRGVAADPRVVAKIKAAANEIARRIAQKAEAETAKLAERQAQDRQIAEFIAQHGTASQKARLKANVMPREEAVTALRDHVFAPFDGFDRYKKITRSDIEDATDTDNYSYDEDEALQFDTEPLSEMNAETWDRYEAGLQAAAEAFGDAAKVEARLHLGGFEYHNEWAVKIPSALVTATVGAFTFSREYAI